MTEAPEPEQTQPEEAQPEQAQPEQGQPDETQPESSDDIRVGVYVCHCGGNISDVVDVKAVAAALAEHPKVAVAREYPFMCSDPGQALVVQDIKEKGINRVVVTACSPTLHELTFRKALERAGLNPYLFEHVNIREQLSWVHKDDPAGATRKAIHLAMAGVEKVIRQDPLEPIRVNVEPEVVVIGGGVAGLRASLSVARQGLGVLLVEKTDKLGGHLNDFGHVYPTEEAAAELLAKLVADVRAEDGIQVLTESEVTGMGGHVGKFRVTIRRKSDKDSEGGEGAGGSELEVTAGVIILATGFDDYRPSDGEFGYGQSPAVITLPDFLRLLAAQPAGAAALSHEGREVKRIGFIHCVGSRQVEGVHDAQADGKLNDYCSRTCCTATMHAIEKVQERYPQVRVFDLNKDVRTYGRGHEYYYEDDSKRGALFFRYPDEEPPRFEPSPAGGGTLVFRDRLTWGEELAAPVDLVVLVTGMVASDIADLINMRKLPVGADGFLQEVHPKLRPVEMTVAGVLLAGTCQGPMDIGEACAAGETAGVKAAILLSKPAIELDPFVAVVDLALCDGCGLCVDECSYKGALEMGEVEVDGETVTRAIVTPALCVGCGACVAVCPPRALNLAGWTLDQFDAMVDAIVAPELEASAEAVAAAAAAAASTSEEDEAEVLEPAAVQAMVKAARAKRGVPSPDQTERGKHDRQIQRTILAAIADEAKTAPDVAAQTGLPEQDVFWWLEALRKYDLVSEEAKRRGPISYKKK